MNQLKQQHRRDLATPPPSSASSSTMRPHSSQKLPIKLLESMLNPAVASVSTMYKRDESLTENLRQQLLHRFKLFAIKLKHENMNGESGDFYEQCFNFLGNLIMSNIQGVSKEMFSSNNCSSTTTTVHRVNLTPSIKRPTVPTVTIKREDGNTFVKKFTCNVCMASLPSLKHLERHSIQHTGEKPHICEVSFRRRTLALFF